MTGITELLKGRKVRIELKTMAAAIGLEDVSCNVFDDFVAVDAVGGLTALVFSKRTLYIQTVHIATLTVTEME